METKPMKILMIEDDIEDCMNLKKCIKQREDIELVGITDSDIEGLRIVKEKKPEGIILDIELNNSNNGNADGFEFLSKIKKLDCNPIIIVVTHINSKRTYEILHKNGVELIIYKDQAKFSYNNVLNKFINFRNSLAEEITEPIEKEIEKTEANVSDCIYKELELIGVTPKMKGREYLHEAILYLLEHPNDDTSVIKHLVKQFKKAGNTITNGMQNAIIHAWRNTSIEDLERNYTAKINYNTGIPTPMEFIYYYVDKIKKQI